MFEDCSSGELVAVVEDTRRVESQLWARRAGAIAALLWERTAEAEGHGEDDDLSYALVTGFARTCAEVGAALNIASGLASRLVSQAEALDTRLPKILALLGTGGLDWSDATTIITRTEYVDAELMPELDAALAARIAGWDCWSRRRLLNAVDAAVRRADPEAAKERRRNADTDRRVTLSAQPNGMASLRGQVSAPAGALFDQRLTAMATGVCAQDPRTLAQRRADAIEALGWGRFTLECACGRPECPVETTDATPPGPGRVVINVIASADTLAGRSQEPGYLDGYGVIDAEQVRDLADGGALLRPTAAPTDPQAAEVLRHQPSAAVARWIRCRDLTCSFPGCNRSAWRADLDHIVPFDHQNPGRGGWTLAGNLGPKCRQHHLLKTFHNGPDGWRDNQYADGTIEWTSPTGRVYRSTPEGAELFADIDTACTTVAPRPRNHRRDKTRRTARARAGMATKRAANIDTLRINRARAHEIEMRQWRNEVRDKLFVLKGKPSTSPWCRWVNDPPEDEHITADWRPPPTPPTNNDEEPPF